MKCTRQRCQVELKTFAAAFFRPSWLSEITSLTPLSPRRVSERRNEVQNGSASDGPTSSPSNSRRPSVLTAKAIITATDTILPDWRAFTYVASIHRYGHAPSIGRLRNALTRTSISAHSHDTWLFEMPVMPIAFTRSSTERVETPCT